MLVLLLIFFVVFVILAVVLGASTLAIQGYIYSEPVGDIGRRAPAAGAALTLFLALWAFLDYRMLDPAQADLPLDTLFRFNPTEIYEVEQFTSIRAPVVMAGETQSNTQEIVYQRRGTGAQGPADYVDRGGKRWERSDATGMMVAIIAKDNSGQEMRFEPKVIETVNPNDPQGPKIKVFAQAGEVFPGYHQKGGRREMLQLGVISVFRWWLFLGNLFFNALHLAVWFVTLWLILRFQWTHALGLAALLWLATSLVVVPMLLAKTQEVARKRSGMSTASAVRNIVERASGVSACQRASRVSPREQIQKCLLEDVGS